MKPITAGIWTLVCIQSSGDRTLVAFTFADLESLNEHPAKNRARHCSIPNYGIWNLVMLRAECQQ
jgi:hypothetical protein